MARARTRRSFDDWLWHLSNEDLARLTLDDLHRRAAASGMEMPQISVSTTIADELHDPVALLSQGVGAFEHRPTEWGGLIRARMQDRRYTVMVRRAAVGVYHILGSIPFTDHAWRRVDQSWIPRAHPHLSGVLLNRPDFELLGDVLAEHGNVRVNRMTARVLSDASSYSRGWPVIQPSHREALSEASRGMVVQSLSLTAGATAMHLRRSAGATFYRGDWTLFVGIVLRRLAEAALARRLLLTDRARHAGARVTETLVMRLQPFAATAPETRARLLRAVNKLRGGRTAVLHGNPYLHVIATDHLDGSSFDLLVTDDDELRIIPGLKATTGSLARLTDAVGAALGMDELALEEVPEAIPDEAMFAA